MHPMTPLPDITAVASEIRRGVEVTLQNHCYVDSAILIYSGIDSMAYLSMPESQDDVTRFDFVQWCDRYIRPDHPHAPTSLELYAARCGVVHSHSAASRLFRDGGKVRQLFYMSDTRNPVLFDPAINKEMLLLSVPALCGWFFDGLDRFIADLRADSELARIANVRLENILHTATTSKAP